MIDETLEFKAFEVSEFTGNAAPTFSGHIVQRTVRDLPLGNVLVRVSDLPFSSCSRGRLPF